jgi:hypothetical protein
MATPVLTPASNSSTTVLPITGTLALAQDVTSYPFGIYADTSSDLYDANFISGALDQVAYTYKMLGGSVLDVELTEQDVYTAYETAVLEYSYIINLHQAKNSLTTVLGAATGTFDHDGIMQSGALKDALSGSHAALKLPKFEFEYSRKVADTVSAVVAVGGSEPEYSASVRIEPLKQDYDLQAQIMSSSAVTSSLPYYQKVGNTKIRVKKVFYKTPHAMWRFYGYFGGLSSVGNLSTYGQYADDSSFEIIPVWQNKIQGIMYEDAIWTRNSHWSYRLVNNQLRLYPIPTTAHPTEIWFTFTIPEDGVQAWQSDSQYADGTDGVNNMNTLPFGNLPYNSINSIGKQWIRRFAVAVAKEMLGQIRGKFAVVPIPGGDVTLNHSELLSQAKDEQEKLREELKTILDELTYQQIAEREQAIMESAKTSLMNVPNAIYVG